jgi:hypothetical protein
MKIVRFSQDGHARPLGCLLEIMGLGTIENPVTDA